MKAKRNTDRRECQKIDADINDEEGSKRRSPGEVESATDKEPEQQFVTLSLRALRSASAHLPPAVRHDKGDGHRGPFVPARRRLLAVPQNDDLE